MYILGIESSCDETSASVVEGDTRTLRSDIVASQIEIHRLYGGVVPEIAGRAHIEAISRVAYRALNEAGVSLSEIGAVAVTAFPGLIGALLVGVNFAKSLAYANNIPLVAVNHIKAHVAAAYLTDPTLEPPFLAVVVSGGHTSIFEVNGYTDFKEIGATRDDAAGEAFDKIGRVIGMPYPGGAALDKLAYEGDPNSIKFPSPALRDSLDFSFSGLKTAALNHINTLKQQGKEPDAANIAAAYTSVITSASAAKTEEAIKRTGYRRIVLAGGVAANSHLRRALTEVCEKYSAKLTVPPISLCGDNAAMVAMAGYFEYLKGNISGVELNASAVDQY